MTGPRLWHGGAPGLRPGDRILPGRSRTVHAGCPWCEARAKGETGPGGIDPLAGRPDRVYLTPVREYARHYASLYGRGDLYRVDPVGVVERSAEDTVETWVAEAAVVTVVVERAVLLTMGQRRRLDRIWAAADEATG